MFSNLSKGSVLYGLETGNGIKLFTGSVENITIPRPKYPQNTFGQIPEMVIDIVATINGERREFQQVPSNNVIADFGPNSVILSDSRDSLMNHIRTLRQKSKNIVDSAPTHKELIPQYDSVLSELDPNSISDSAVKELSNKVNGMESQMSEILSLLRQRTTNPV